MIDKRVIDEVQVLLGGELLDRHPSLVIILDDNYMRMRLERLRDNINILLKSHNPVLMGPNSEEVYNAFNDIKNIIINLLGPYTKYP